MDEEHQSSLSQSDTTEEDEEETEEESSSGYDDEDDEEDEVSEEDIKNNISVITEEEESDVFTSEFSADLSSSRSLATADIEDSLMDMSIPQLRRYTWVARLVLDCCARSQNESSDGIVFLEASSGSLLSPPPQTIPEVSACSLEIVSLKDLYSRRKVRVMREEEEEEKEEGNRAGSNRYCTFR